MSQPVTSNPLIIMLINMTVVFFILISLGFVIKLIHKIDPTVRHEKKEAVPAQPVAAPAPEPAPEPVAPGIPPEVVAVIAAAVASCGYSAQTIRAIRPVDRNGWKQSGRDMVAGRALM
ncbi:OadG family protein [Mitsuokella sp.]|uniref:OadG family protein n=1 Tax=Mitsuokella sp. TaxID=2049034 RepID=UPI0029E5AD88|nr:OadG family protein [Mitsuokella sp.]MDD6382244.1 OadG family protein [Selenomonadaceae bacterium]MDY4473952.1 OadG family protein [Mitsuokella sp.]